MRNSKFFDIFIYFNSIGSPSLISSELLINASEPYELCLFLNIRSNDGKTSWKFGDRWAPNTQRQLFEFGNIHIGIYNTTTVNCWFGFNVKVGKMADRINQRGLCSQFVRWNVTPWTSTIGSQNKYTNDIFLFGLYQRDEIWHNKNQGFKTLHVIIILYNKSTVQSYYYNIQFVATIYKSPQPIYTPPPQCPRLI